MFISADNWLEIRIQLEKEIQKLNNDMNQLKSENKKLRKDQKFLTEKMNGTDR